VFTITVEQYVGVGVALDTILALPILYGIGIQKGGREDVVYYAIVVHEYFAMVWAMQVGREYRDG